MILKAIREFLSKFGYFTKTRKMKREDLYNWLIWRHSHMQEELNEVAEAIIQSNEDEIVDGLIDVAYLALGTLELVGVDVEEAWNRVNDANMRKVPGIVDRRPNEWGFDLVKPDNWVSPSHKDNLGILKDK